MTLLGSSTPGPESESCLTPRTIEFGFGKSHA